MYRRTVLAALGAGVVSLAGCAGQRGPGTTPTSPESTPTSPERTPTDLTTETPTTASEVELIACPERPASLTREGVVAYAMQFERAYTMRRTLRGTSAQIVSIDVDVDESTVEAEEATDGWVVRFRVVGPAYRYRPTPGSTETAHVDPGMYVANYLVTDRRVRRAQAVEAVDPRENGVDVSCPPA